MKQLEGNKI